MVNDEKFNFKFKFNAEIMLKINYKKELKNLEILSVEKILK